MQDPKKIHIKKVLPKCIVTGCLKKGEFENGICGKCKIKMSKSKAPKKAITQVSEKRKKENKEYLKLRNEFLKKNNVCAVTGNKATEVHHMRGRIGKLLTDVRCFLPVSREGHQKIELNPTWAKEMGFSLNRTNKK